MELDATEPERPLLLIPGICGSMLQVRPKGSEEEGDRVWVTLVNADAQYQRLWGRFEAQGSSLECLIPGTEVVVPQGTDESGLYPISVLDPLSAGAVRDVHVMDALVDYLQGKGYSAGRDLFGFGYDFRQSVRSGARALLARLHELSRRSGGRKLDVVTHSLGGLVVRALLAEAHEEFGALVHTWVAIGCPFGGAPGWVVDALVTGVQFGGSLGQMFFVNRDTFRQACLQSPAVFELLPPLDFPYKQPPPQLRIWFSAPIPGLEAHLSSAAPGQPQAQQQQQQQQQQDKEKEQLSAHQPTPGVAAAAGGGAAAAARNAPGTTMPAAAGRDALPAAAVAALKRALGAIAAHSRGAGSRSGGRASGSINIRPGSAQNTPGGSNINGRREYVFQHKDLPGLLQKVLKDNSVTLERQEYALPFNKDLWSFIQETQELWASAELPEGCRFFNLYGRGLSTPYDVTYGSRWRPVQDLSQLQSANATFGYVDGDMTVPTESALADGLEAEERVGIKAAHRDLITAPAAWDQVLRWLRRGESTQRDAWVLVPPAVMEEQQSAATGQPPAPINQMPGVKVELPVGAGGQVPAV